MPIVQLTGARAVIDANGNRIASVATPTMATDAANRQYVDDRVSSLTSVDIPMFDPAVTYNAGDFVYLSNRLYRATGTSTGSTPTQTNTDWDPIEGDITQDTFDALVTRVSTNETNITDLDNRVTILETHPQGITRIEDATDWPATSSETIGNDDYWNDTRRGDLLSGDYGARFNVDSRHFYITNRTVNVTGLTVGDIYSVRNGFVDTNNPGTEDARFRVGSFSSRAARFDALTDETVTWLESNRDAGESRGDLYVFDTAAERSAVFNNWHLVTPGHSEERIITQEQNRDVGTRSIGGSASGNIATVDQIPTTGTVPTSWDTINNDPEIFTFTTSGATLNGFVRDWNAGDGDDISSQTSTLDRGDFVSIVDNADPANIHTTTYFYQAADSTFVSGGAPTGRTVAETDFREIGIGDTSLPTGDLTSITRTGSEITVTTRGGTLFVFDIVDAVTELRGNFEFPLTDTGGNQSFTITYNLNRPATSLQVRWGTGNTAVNLAHNFTGDELSDTVNQGRHTASFMITSSEADAIVAGNFENTLPSLVFTDDDGEIVFPIFQDTSGENGGPADEVVTQLTGTYTFPIENNVGQDFTVTYHLNQAVTSADITWSGFSQTIDAANLTAGTHTINVSVSNAQRLLRYIYEMHLTLDQHSNM